MQVPYVVPQQLRAAYVELQQLGERLEPGGRNARLQLMVAAMRSLDQAATQVHLSACSVAGLDPANCLMIDEDPYQPGPLTIEQQQRLQRQLDRLGNNPVAAAIAAAGQHWDTTTHGSPDVWLYCSWRRVGSGSARQYPGNISALVK